MLWFNKHYKDWEVSSGINENPQFSKRLKEVLKRNLTTPEGYQNGNQVTKTVSGGYRNSNPQVTETVSQGYRNGNLKGAQLIENTEESPSVNKVKEICKDNINKYTTYDVHDPLPPSPLACVFFDTVSRYPEFDVREDDLIWFKRRVEGNERF